MTATLRVVNHSSRASEGHDAPIEIALVNNMPDAALQTTEQQFTALLGAAGADYNIRIRFFSFPELIRGQGGRSYVAEHYEPIEQLWSG